MIVLYVGIYIVALAVVLLFFAGATKGDHE
jgi:hypothetical protein